MNILIWGIAGSMGRSLYCVASNSKTEKIIGGFDKLANQEDFDDIPIYSNIKNIDILPDIIIDFSRPEAVDEILSYAVDKGINIVIATTGHTEKQLNAIKKASEHIAIFMSSNMSLGINLLVSLAKQAAKFLGKNYEIEIIEQHHNRKIDSPSGTALTLAKDINSVYDNDMQYCYGRHSDNQKRGTNVIGIHAIRGGAIVGKHDVMYIGADEIVTLSHEAQSRQIFARGSIRAAHFVSDKRNGMYSMKDIIGKDYSVTNISGDRHITLVTLKKVTISELSDVLDELESNKVNIDMVSEVLDDEDMMNISFTIADLDKPIAESILSNYKINFLINGGLAKLSIEGAGMEHQYGVTAKIFRLFRKVNIKISAITTSETKISCCVSQEHLDTCIDILKKDFGVY